MQFRLTLMGLLLFGGCSGRVPVAEVTGQVLKNGIPLAEVHVEFLPDPEQETTGPLSFGDTADDGTFSLQLYGDSPVSGAVIGWHRVTLQDYKSLNSRDKPVPPRFDQRFGFAGSTPIQIQVLPGMEPVRINLDDY